MNDKPSKNENLIDTTDCLEAVGVFRGWKNFLFVIIVLCLLLLQVAFWAVNTGFVKTNEEAGSDMPSTVKEDVSVEVETETTVAADGMAEQIQEAAKKIAGEVNQPAEAAVKEERSEKEQAFLRITFSHLSGVVRMVNFLLVPVAVLYCLTMLFSLKVSLLGRLGGINHIGRAFFLSLVFVVLLLPWQRFFAGVIVGVMYTPMELLKACRGAGEMGIFESVVYYLRFTGYWLLVMVILVFSQLRSCRWTKATLRRLEVI